MRKQPFATDDPRHALLKHVIARDISKVGKQDDSAARRFFHSFTLLLMTSVPETASSPTDYTVRDGFNGLFAVHFVFGGSHLVLSHAWSTHFSRVRFYIGELFDSWFHRRMSHFDRVRIALRAKFFLAIIRHDLRLKCEKHHDVFHNRQSFISYESREIMESLCDGLVLLVLAHSEYYPKIPLCPWEHGTESLEHLFGAARQLLGKFKYIEFIKHLKAITIRQQLRTTVNYNAQKRSRSASGCVTSAQSYLSSNVVRSHKTNCCVSGTIRCRTPETHQ